MIHLVACNLAQVMTQRRCIHCCVFRFLQKLEDRTLSLFFSASGQLNNVESQRGIELLRSRNVTRTSWWTSVCMVWFDRLLFGPSACFSPLRSFLPLSNSSIPGMFTVVSRRRNSSSYLCSRWESPPASMNQWSASALYIVQSYSLMFAFAMFNQLPFLLLNDFFRLRYSSKIWDPAQHVTPVRCQCSRCWLPSTCNFSTLIYWPKERHPRHHHHHHHHHHPPPPPPRRHLLKLLLLQALEQQLKWRYANNFLFV